MKRQAKGLNDWVSDDQPRPIWLRMPWPVSSSVPRPITKPSMARRPFQVSAKATKPKREEDSAMDRGCLRNVKQVYSFVK